MTRSEGRQETMPAVDLGRVCGPFPGRLDAEYVDQYRAATGSPVTVSSARMTAPPTAIVTQIWDAQDAARTALVDPGLLAAAAGGVHGEHDLMLHRPITVGEPLTTWVRGFGARPVGRNAAVTLHFRTLDEAGDPVAEQWWTTIYLATSCAPVGAVPPDHRFPDAARSTPPITHTTAVDAAMPRRYAEVSGDWSPHHFDVDAARRSGADRPFLHGLATFAMCAQAVVASVADGDPDRLRRFAVRFAAPTYPVDDLTVRLYATGPSAFAFEAENAGRLVIGHGRAELRP